MGMSPVEKIFYELKPFLCLWMGYIALGTHAMARIGKVPAAGLIVCGLIVLLMRLEYRGFFGTVKVKRSSKKRRY
jgi:hypothetical protein